MKALGAFTAVVIVFLLAPLAFVFYQGANPAAFARLAQRPDILSAGVQSLSLALASSVVATLIGTATAFALPAMPRMGRRLIQAGLIFPMVLPEIAFGLSLLVWFIKLGWPLGWGSLVSAHVAFSVSYATLVMKTRLEAMDPNLVDAAYDLGAGPWQAFRTAVLPQLAPGLAASLLTCFSLSLDDFLISFFVKGLDQMTLPVQIYSMMRVRLGPEVYALSVVLFCFSVAGVLLSQLWFLSRRKIS